jgi:hypothetical protein
MNLIAKKCLNIMKYVIAVLIFDKFNRCKPPKARVPSLHLITMQENK